MVLVFSILTKNIEINFFCHDFDFVKNLVGFVNK